MERMFKTQSAHLGTRPRSSKQRLAQLRIERSEGFHGKCSIPLDVEVEVFLSARLRADRSDESLVAGTACCLDRGEKAQQNLSLEEKKRGLENT